MKIKDVIAVIEAVAPLALQESYDNGGLNVGMPDDDVTAVMVCVDVTDEVVSEAIAKGANLIVSHHPLLFHPLRQLGGNNYIERLIRRCVKENIALYAAHTALDRARHGVSYKMADLLGLEHRTLLIPYDQAEDTGFGIVGDLKKPMKTQEFLCMVKDVFGCRVIRHSRLFKEEVSKIALSSGAGGSFINDAQRAGADIFLSADLKYNDFFASENGIMVADLGHFESEYCSIDLLHDIITKKISTFAIYKSESSENPVQYL